MEENTNLNEREKELLKNLLEKEIESFGENNSFLKIEYLNILDKLELKINF